MKSVKGTPISSAPVSLSKAAKILSKFAASEDNGASPAIANYLNRTSAAFGELVQQHKELRKSKGSSSNRSGNGKKQSHSRTVGESVGYSVGNAENVESEENSSKKETSEMQQNLVKVSEDGSEMNNVEKVKKNRKNDATAGGREERTNSGVQASKHDGRPDNSQQRIETDVKAELKKEKGSGADQTGSIKSSKKPDSSDHQAHDIKTSDGVATAEKRKHKMKKKKQTDQEEKVNEVESLQTRKKESKKRKSEEVADAVSPHGAENQHRSKKKKIKLEDH